jgi:sugar transferase (PEP-CTERM/EpsH1 system associated)
MKHLVHLVHSFGTGGMENGMVNLFNTLPPTRYRHSVVALTDYSDFRQRINAQPVEFHALHRAPGNGVAWTLRLARLLRRLQPDLVHTRNLAALEAQFVARAAGVARTVHGEHGRDVFDLYGRNWKYNLLRRAARPLVSHYIAVSRDLAGWLTETVGVAPTRVTQIYNGVDTGKFRPRGDARPDVLPRGFVQPDSVVVGAVGRMAEVKNFPFLVRAFVELAAAQPALAARMRLVIVGDGAARAECQARLNEAGLAEYAWLPGARDDIADLLRAMDVFVLPSRNEGVSNTILEAMASGLPVIATAVGGNVELVEDGVTGELVASDDTAGLVAALARWLAEPTRIIATGQAARRAVAARFSIPAMADAYAAVYDRVLAKN